MIQRKDGRVSGQVSGQVSGHVSMVVHFRPRQVRAAAEWLAALLRDSGNVVVTWDASCGNVELANVRGVDLRALTDRLYQHGASSVFVRYQHEGRRISIAYGADDGRDPGTRGPEREAARLLN
jgi:thioredoxin reductase